MIKCIQNLVKFCPSILKILSNQRTNGPVKRSPDIWAKHKIKFGSKWPNHFWEKPVLIFKLKWPWAKVKKWPWPSILTYLHYLNRLQVTGCDSSEKSKVFTFFYRSLSYQILPCHRIGQGQPRVIIWTNYDGQESPMLHTKFCGNQSIDSREEVFWRVFYHIWAWQPFWSCDQHHVNKFSFPWTWKLTYKIRLWLAQWYLRKASVKFHM